MYVNLGSRSYEIMIRSNALKDLGFALQTLGLKGKTMVVSDTNVAPLWAGQVKSSLSAAGFLPILVTLPAGEEAKSLGWTAHLYSSAVSAALDRSSVVIALGGGVVGDAAGFLAATYLRGLPFVQVPTSLLAQVDSAVGGKVAINLPQGKNLVGSFHQPRLVVADPKTLSSLPRREFTAALGEIIKYGIILDAAFFTYLEYNLPVLLAQDETVLTTVIESCLTLKAQVVAADEREEEHRSWLNFGHTVGHVLEAASQFTLRHGEAVALGILAETELAQRLGLIGTDVQARVAALLSRAGLANPQLSPVPWAVARPLFYRDKKVKNGVLRFALPVDLGQCRMVQVAETEVERLWRDLKWT
ncbi:MAG: 3-dehydroquinate synthase [Firmicutes bacterium]|nr:3-dehydroquinate synthase [Bacillota bacterium]